MNAHDPASTEQRDLRMIGRLAPLFETDVADREQEISDIVRRSRFLVIGAAGSIGQAVSKEIFARNPRALDVVDISENNLVELVRDLRSSTGYGDGEFRSFALDAGSVEFAALMKQGGRYDYVLNLSALKHVRSEKDAFTLMRMLAVNVLNTETTVLAAKAAKARKYFCVSTDKATAPVNLMGASKRVMEKHLMGQDHGLDVSTARFANVAFSDGSLLHGFNQRIAKRQPLSAPRDVQRYFLTFQEAGILCLLSTLFGQHRDIFFPKLGENLGLTTFSEIATRYLHGLGYEPAICDTEQQARDMAREGGFGRRWPCYFFDSDTTGEKPVEEFYLGDEDIDFERFLDVGVIRNPADANADAMRGFIGGLRQLRARGSWSKAEIVALFAQALPELTHQETGKYLDGRM